jgi:hypothetical protein
MRNLIRVWIVISVLIVGIVLVIILLWPQRGLQRTSLAEHKHTVFRDAGIQMEIPTKTPFVSSSSAGVLIMVHRVSRGWQAEAEYLIKIDVIRISRMSMDNRLKFASQPTSDHIQQWRYKIHSRLDVRKEPDIWYIRKDVEIPDGSFIFIDGELKVTEYVETDLFEINRIIESIKFIPK